MNTDAMLLPDALLEEGRYRLTGRENIDPVAKIFSSLHFSNEGETAAKDLLPRPEELPPFPQRNDAFAATL